MPLVHGNAQFLFFMKLQLTGYYRVGCEFGCGCGCEGGGGKAVEITFRLRIRLLVEYIYIRITNKGSKLLRTLRHREKSCNEC